MTSPIRCARSWPAYSSYRDSGIPLVGAIPSHWKLALLDKVVDPVRRITYGIVQPGSLDPNGRFMVRGQNYSRGWSRPEDVFRVAPAVEEPYRRARLKSGDLVMTIVGAGTGNVAVVPDWLEGANITQTTARIAIRPKHGSNRYFAYLLESPVGKTNVEVDMKGAAQPGLTLASIGKWKILVPPSDEQPAIAAFLDRETAKIDALVAKKERLIELLLEKLTSTIGGAVTRGLSEHSQVHPSGVEWLGDIPTSWDTWKVTHGFGIIGSGTTPKSDDRSYYDDGDIPWVTTSELRENVITDTAAKLTRKALQDYPVLRVYDPGTLLFAMYGATIGRLGILGVPATVNQACCAFSKPTKFDTKFVFYWLWMRRPVLVALSEGGGQPNLSQDDLRELRIPGPSIPEQAAIASTLDEVAARIGSLVGRVRQAIGQLQNLRASLIHAAVTGKIDVRSASASENRVTTS